MAQRGYGDFATPGQILARQRLGMGAYFGGGALGDHASAVDARAQAHIHYVVRSHDRVFVVFHHDHRVADIPQALQGLDEPRVVTLMQADRRLIQHVHHAGQSRADLRRQTYALRLSAGERIGGAVERQIVETHVHQKLQAIANLVNDLVGYCAPRTTDIHGGKKLNCLI